MFDVESSRLVLALLFCISSSCEWFGIDLGGEILAGRGESFTAESSSRISFLPLTTYSWTGLDGGLRLCAVDLYVFFCLHSTRSPTLIARVRTRICARSGGVGAMLALLKLHTWGLSRAPTNMW